MRAFEQFVEQPKLGEQLKRRGMDSIAAKVAQEVGVFFQHQRPHARAREQQSGHHAGRSAADDEHSRFACRVWTAPLGIRLSCWLRGCHERDSCVSADLRSRSL